MIFFKLALKEIRNNFRFSLFFVFNLTLGLSGMAAIDTLKQSVNMALHERAKGILAADIGVGARRPLHENEKSQLFSLMPEGTVKSQVVETFTMIVGSNDGRPVQSRLVEMKAIDSDYPYYGEIELKKAGLITSSTPKDLFNSPRIWVYPELLLQLNLQVGEHVKIGTTEFLISDTITKDSSGVGAGFSFAPPVYVSRENLYKAGLIKEGSTAYITHLFQMPDNPQMRSESYIEKLAEVINKTLPDPAIKVFTSRNSSEMVGRLIMQLGDYLGLAGLVAVFLMLLGQVFLYRNFLVQRYKDIAIFKSLGVSNDGVLKIYLTQVLVLSFFAIFPALAVGLFVLPAIKNPVYELTRIQIEMSLHPSTIILVISLSLIGTTLVSAPLLLRSLKIRPRELFQPSEALPALSLRKYWLYYLPAMLSYFAISLWMAKSYYVGSLFFGLLTFAVLSLSGLGYLLLQMLSIVKTTNIPLKLALRSLVREKFATLSAFLALSLGVLLSVLIPQLEKGIRSEIETPSGIEHPSLFLFDIQEEQVSGLKDLLQRNNISLMQVSPMIRSRLMSVNEQSFEKVERQSQGLTREEETENRFRNRGFNLTYRNELSPSERIISGTPFFEKDREPLIDQKFKTENQISQISLESRFASRLGLKIGDILNFDVQGVEVSGQVVNLRKVRWTSFQPNFFIQFQEGPLNEAPKTFLATIGPLSMDQKLSVQNRVVKSFPNISLIDVSRLIERLSGLISQMSLALLAMAFFSMVVGIVVLFSIANQKAYEKIREMTLFKVLGASFGTIRLTFIYEFSILALFASLSGAALSMIISYILSTRIFDAAFAFDPKWLFIFIIITLLVSLFITLIVLRKVLRAHPRELLS